MYISKSTAIPIKKELRKGFTKALICDLVESVKTDPFFNQPADVRVSIMTETGTVTYNSDEFLRNYSRYTVHRSIEINSYSESGCDVRIFTGRGKLTVCVYASKEMTESQTEDALENLCCHISDLLDKQSYGSKYDDGSQENIKETNKKQNTETLQKTSHILEILALVIALPGAVFAIISLMQFFKCA